MNFAPQVDAILIRPMQAEDLAQVHAIDKTSFSMPWSARAYAFELNENPASLLLVAEDTARQAQDQRVVGMVVVWLIVDEAHIATIAVHPDYRGRGIARRLLRSVLIDSIHKGMVQATLEVRAHNIIAQNLYKGFQFEIVGRRPRYYRDNNEDAFIMTASNLGESYLAWLENDTPKSSLNR